MSLLHNIIKPLCDRGSVFIVFLFICILNADQGSPVSFEHATRYYTLLPEIISLTDEKPKSLAFYSIDETWNLHHFEFYNKLATIKINNNVS